MSKLSVLYTLYHDLFCMNAEHYGVRIHSERNHLQDVVDRRGWFICRPIYCSLLQKLLFECDNLSDCFSRNQNQIRAPLLSNKSFLDLATHSSLIRMIQGIHNDLYFNQQNVLNMDASTTRHKDQSRWHRDMPYQTWIPSSIAALNSLLCLSNSKERIHVLDIIDGSQFTEAFPCSTALNSLQRKIYLKHGDLLVMNSFMYHRAPTKITDNSFLINQVFTPKIFKQQVSLVGLSKETDCIDSKQDLSTWLGTNQTYKTKTSLVP